MKIIRKVYIYCCYYPSLNFYYPLHKVIITKNIMQSPRQLNQKQLQQASLYQDLAQLIKLFKNILEQTQSISLQLSKPEECLQNILNLRSFIRQEHKLMEKHSYEVDEGAQHRNINQRFVCRIIENLQVFKNRSHGACQTSNIFLEFINRIDALLHSWRLGKNIGKLFKKLCSITESFCKSCEIIINRGSNLQALQYFLRKSKQQKQEGHNFQSPLKKYHFASSQSNFQKLMTGLAKRYNTMSCLDLDYSAFKTTFFRSKNEKSQIQSQMLQRNCFIERQIYLYSKEFEDYLKRKEKIFIRRNRFKDNPKNFGNTQSISVQGSKYLKNSIDITRVFETQNQQSQSNDSKCEIHKHSDVKEMHSKIYEISQEKLLQYQKRRSSYQIKNVFLTLNKIQVNDINKNKIKPQKKYECKDKNKEISIFKPNKYNLRSSKFVSSQLMRGDRPLLQIRHINWKGYEMDSQQEQSNLLFKRKQDEILKIEKIQKVEPKKARIPQILKKNSIGLNINGEVLNMLNRSKLAMKKKDKQDQQQMIQQN